MRSHQYIIGEVLSVEAKKNTIARFFFSAIKACFESIHLFGPFVLLILILPESSFSQQIAVVVPETSSISADVSKRIESGLSSEFDITERSMSEMIFADKRFERPFNLSIDDSKNFGGSVGCNYFLLIKTETLRRTSFEREKYYESYLSYFLVSSRTGKLLNWKLLRYEDDSPESSKHKLTASIGNAVAELARMIRTSEEENSTYRFETSEIKLEADFDGSEDFRPPMPFARVKPEYTKTAGLYDVQATVDAAVDIDEKGEVNNIEIVRWAGFGLEESVINTIRELKWRPADLRGKTLAMRVLLRYNFRNIETDSETDTK